MLHFTYKVSREEEEGFLFVGLDRCYLACVEAHKRDPERGYWDSGLVEV